MLLSTPLCTYGFYRSAHHTRPSCVPNTTIFEGSVVALHNVEFRVRSVVSDDSDPPPHAATRAVAVNAAILRLKKFREFFIPVSPC